MHSLTIPIVLKMDWPEGDLPYDLRESIRWLYFRSIEEARQEGMGWTLEWNESGLGLIGCDEPGSLPLRLDFFSGKLGYRLERARQEMACKAVGVKGNTAPSVLDATAGLARDGLLLAMAGCQVTLLERSPVVYLLLWDAFRRWPENRYSDVKRRLQLYFSDAAGCLESMETGSVDVVYLDPMFPHRQKSALVKKEMRMFREVVGDDLDSPALCHSARRCARHRVVVKRPLKAPGLIDDKPNFTLKGKSHRFDVYRPLPAIR